MEATSEERKIGRHQSHVIGGANLQRSGCVLVFLALLVAFLEGLLALDEEECEV